MACDGALVKPFYDSKVGRCRLYSARTWVRTVDPRRAWFQRLKLNYDKLLSSFAVNCNLRHYGKECYRAKLTC